MEEIWMFIVGTNERYSISNYGNVRANWYDVPVRNLTHKKRINKSRMLLSWVHTTGYKRVSLGRQNTYYVHRLVATHFLENPDNLPQVDHIDGDRTNNFILNLRWVSAKLNAFYGGERHHWETQRLASAKRRIHDAKKHEYQAFLEQGYSLRHIARLFGTSHSAISNALKN